MNSRKVVRRKSADARQAQLLQLVHGGITDPRDAAAYMGITTNGVLKYANASPDLTVVPVKIDGTGRIRVELALKHPTP